MPASELLPAQPDLSVSQLPGKLRADALKSTDHLLVVVPDKPAATVWKQIPDGERLRSLGQKRRLGDGKLRGRLRNANSTGITVLALPGSGNGKKAAAAFELLKLAGTLAADALTDNPASVAIMAAGFAAEQEERILQALS